MRVWVHGHLGVGCQVALDNGPDSLALFGRFNSQPPASHPPRQTVIMNEARLSVRFHVESASFSADFPGLPGFPSFPNSLIP